MLFVISRIDKIYMILMYIITEVGTKVIFYYFRTVWYELLCGEWPFKGQPPESIIWQVGKGMKQPLANLQASRDVKVIVFALKR